MNSVIALAGVSPNQVLYGHTTRDGVNLLVGEAKHMSREDKQTLFRQETADAISFANAKAKIRYNRRHKQLKFKVGDKVYLRLHHEYTLLDMNNKKLSNQRVGPFEILQKVGQLAYKLRLPPVMQIYPIVSIAQLEPAKSTDPYSRRRLDHPRPVEMERISPNNAADGKLDSNTQPNNSYEVEQILSKRSQKYGWGKSRIEYRVKWLGWGPELNQWIPEEDCAGAAELVKEFERKQDTEHSDRMRNTRAAMFTNSGEYSANTMPS